MKQKRRVNPFNEIERKVINGRRETQGVPVLVLRYSVVEESLIGRCKVLQR